MGASLLFAPDAVNTDNGRAAVMCLYMMEYPYCICARPALGIGDIFATRLPDTERRPRPVGARLISRPDIACASSPTGLRPIGHPVGSVFNFGLRTPADSRGAFVVSISPIFRWLLRRRKSRFAWEMFGARKFLRRYSDNRPTRPLATAPSPATHFLGRGGWGGVVCGGGRRVLCVKGDFSRNALSTQENLNRAPAPPTPNRPPQLLFRLREGMGVTSHPSIGKDI